MERIAFYRERAEEALQSATVTFHQETREGLLSLAAAWHALADELASAADGTQKARQIPSKADQS